MAYTTITKIHQKISKIKLDILKLGAILIPMARQPAVKIRFSTKVDSDTSKRREFNAYQLSSKLATENNGHTIVPEQTTAEITIQSDSRVSSPIEIEKKL